MTIHGTPGSLDRIEHVAMSVADIDSAVAWYTSNFRCTVAYRTRPWALLDFANLQLALGDPRAASTAHRLHQPQGGAIRRAQDAP
jgi:catechol 2,3-dioxygenase-like lactoylglutathione lyase family enzyme